MIEQNVTNHEALNINKSNNLTKLFTYCIKKLRPISKRHGILITIFALLFTFMLVNGFVLTTWDVDLFVFGKRLILIITAAYVLTFSVFWILLSLLAKWAIKPAPDTPRRVNNRRLLSNYFSQLSDRKFFVVIFGILLIPKILIWIIYGAQVPYDGFQLIRQAAGFTQLDAYRPIINVLVVTPFMQLGKLLGNYHIGIFLWTLCQSIIYAACLTYIVLFLRQIKAKPIIQILSIIAFSVMPIFAIAGIIVWSDILFSSFAVLFAILSYKLIKNPQAYCSSKSSVISFILIAFLFATWRNNGYYAFIIAIPFLIIVLRRHWTRILPLVFAPLVIVIGYYQVLIPSIARSVFPAEYLSVPIQQIARSVYEHGHEMSVEQIDVIARFFNIEIIKSEYNPVFADPMKFHFHYEGGVEHFTEHTGEFVELWLNTLRNYPITSLNAALYNTKGFWYLFDDRKGWATDSIDVNLINSDFELAYESEFNGNQAKQFGNSIRAKTFNIYKEHLFPALLLFNAIPFYLWGLILCVMVLLIRRDNKTLISLAGIFGVIITVFAGPAAEFRYLFCLPLIAPILFAFIFNRPSTETEVGNSRTIVS